ncbi:MAG TPA: InlB B-repeat-containing protein [Tissierellia bacterium]|nr:InlB B-repeat-containing protein [Tissierellia bacterium]
MEYLDLCEGDVEQEIYDLGKFNYTLSNSNFVFNKDNGEITVTVPKGVQFMECDLTLTWKLDKLAFSHYDITVTIPLVWTNLSTEELNERFTASLRAGNAQDGYTTVWSERVMKNQEFDLPTVDEVKAILGVDSYETAQYGNLKYSEINGYGEQQTKGLTILCDQTYYFDVTPRTYTLTVKGVESSNGTKEDREFTSRFGEAFDLSSLANSGTNDDVNRNYTAFLKVVAKDSNGKEILRDVNEPIGRTFAMEILGGATYTATYTDNSALVTFKFEGIDLEPIRVKMRKGDVASTEFFDEELYARNAIVKSISPAFAPISSPITYTVMCEVQEVPVVLRTITFDTKGGSDIEPVSYPVGSVIAKPADPTKPGYTFDGWYSDPDLTQVFFFTTMPDEDITIYAKWRANEYIVTFDPNEGTLS